MISNNSKESKQYLTFRLGDESFALNVVQVREVLDLSPITKVPGTPKYMRGVINVRGGMVPVMDMRLKFGLPEGETTRNNRIIVMEIDSDGDGIVMGAIADSVHEVITLESGEIEDPPKIGAGWRSEFIDGIGKNNDRFIMILDINRVFSTDELALLDGAVDRREKEGKRSA